MNTLSNNTCRCGEEIEPKRLALGIYICKECGEERARRVVRTVVPLHKSNYIVVTDKEGLKELDPKHKS